MVINIFFFFFKKQMFMTFSPLSHAFQMTGSKNRGHNSTSQALPTLLILCCLLQCHSRPHSYDSKPLSEISREVSKYSDIAQQIINLAVYGKAQNRSYERLAEFTDTIGNRVSGSKNLDLAIKYMYNVLRKDGLENVHLEPVKIPHWVRGKESALMLLPRNHTLAILGLGSSVGTPPGG